MNILNLKVQFLLTAENAKKKQRALVTLTAENAKFYRRGRKDSAEDTKETQRAQRGNRIT